MPDIIDRPGADRDSARSEAAALPSRGTSVRITKEQLAAAARAREFHLRKLQNGVYASAGASAGDGASRSERP